MQLQAPVEIPDKFIDELALAITEKVMAKVDKAVKLNDLPPYPTKVQLRKILRIGDDKIKLWIAEGLPVINFGKKETRFDRDDIKAFLDKKKDY